MQVVDLNGNMFGYDYLEIIGINGKPKIPPFSITIGTTTIASGTVGRVLFEGAGNVVQQSANLTFDVATNNFVIGTTATSSPKLLITSSNRSDIVLRSGASANDTLTMYAFGGNYGSNYAQIGVNDGVNAASQGGAIYLDSRTGIAPPIRLTIKGTGTTAMTNAMSVFNTGNVAINTITDAGFKLDVNGTFRAQANSTIVGTNIPLSITGQGTSSFSMNSGNDVYFSFNSQSAVGRFYANPQGTVQNTFDRPTSVGFVGTLAGSDVWYGNMNANGGSVKYNASINGASHSHIWYYNFAEQMRLQFTGNLLIGTSVDTGYRLEVAGTLRVNSGNGSRIEGGGSFTATGFCNFNGASQSVAGTNCTLLNVQTALSVGFAGGADASAVMQANSTTKGFLPPRMTTVQKNAIASPATGLILYDTTLNLPQFYNGTIWVSL